MEQYNHSEHKLELLAENTERFYTDYTMQIVKRAKMLLFGNSDRNEENAWCYAVPRFEAALTYFKGFGLKERMSVAQTLTNNYIEELKLGNY
jgi:hypothetical protein